MGMFKDIWDMKRMADRMSGGVKRPGLRETLSDGSAMMAYAQQQMVQAQAFELAANPLARTGHGTINAIRDTGVTINEDPVVEMQINVTDADGSAYPVLHSQTISRLKVGSIQPGSEVPVRIDPTDRTRIYISL